jgi:RNA polymerase sigma-70 factor, ECF subfamily
VAGSTWPRRRSASDEHWQTSCPTKARYSHAEIHRPDAGLAILDTLELDHYRYFHSTYADLLRRAGRHGDAHHAYQRALDLAQTDPERRFLRNRLAELNPRD